MRCLVFGCGYMGKIRAAVLKNHPDVTQVKIYDPYVNPDREPMAPDLLVPSEIPWKDFDAVFVCTPNNVSAKLAIEGLKNCGHVFCEKPPARNYEELCAVREAARARPDHTLVFGFNHRYHPLVQAAKDLVGEGGLGEVLYLRGTYGKSGGKNYRQSWRNQKEISGGGILLDQGIHMLDLFQYFLGPLKLVNSLLQDSFWKCGVEDNVFVLLRSARGAPVFLHSSATLWKHTFTFEIGCEKGYLKANGLLSQTGSYGREQLVIGRRQFEDEALALGNPREEIVYFDRDDSWRLEVNEFLSAVKEKRKATHGTLEEALQVMALIRDIYAIDSNLL
ncbi:MAG: Gfo/Idh/MocA family oxidoreductase [Deltaproteobacteria bacterium]|nr:Gfo/Idh/MocA family oxidoreductase [Deltaproteobacteria bacterium]